MLHNNTSDINHISYYEHNIIIQLYKIGLAVKLNSFC